MGIRRCLLCDQGKTTAANTVAGIIRLIQRIELRRTRSATSMKARSFFNSLYQPYYTCDGVSCCGLTLVAKVDSGRAPLVLR